MPVSHGYYTCSIEAVLASKYDQNGDDYNQVTDVGLAVVYLTFFVLVLFPVDAEDKGSLHHYLINKSIWIGYKDSDRS